MSAPPLRVVVVGAGRMGADHVERLRRRVRGAEVAVVVDTDLDRAERAAATDPSGPTGPSVATTDLAAALERADIDAVLVATPGDAHEAALLPILQRGLPVLCEKPLTHEATSSWTIVEAEQRSGRRRITVGFMRRFDAEYRILRAMIAAEELGRLLMLHCVHRNPAPPPGFTAAMLITDSVVHEFDAIRFLTGEEISSVQVRVGRSSRHADAVRQRDPQQVLIETEGGVLADVEMFVNAQLGYEVTTDAVFERGVVSIGRPAGPLVHAAGRWGGGIAPGYIERFRAAYDLEVQDWVDGVRGGATSGPTAWDGYAAACCCEAGVASQRSGERVAVSLRSKPALYR